MGDIYNSLYPLLQTLSLITSQQDSECISAPTDSEMSECWGGQVWADYYGPNLASWEADPQVQSEYSLAVCVLWKCQSHPIKNQVSVQEF